MNRLSASFLVGMVGVSALFAAPWPALAAAVEKPAALTADGVPAIPDSLAAATRPYLEFRTAVLQGWHPTDGSMLITTRFANTAQLHRVAAPGAQRTQISFEADRIVGGSWAPRRGDVLVVMKDKGGDEFFQLHLLKDGRLSLLTDGRSRNLMGAWSQDGTLIGYSSTRRNGTDSDLYVIDPRDPKSDRMVAERQGGGWQISGFSPDNKQAVVIQDISVAKAPLWLLDLASGRMRPIGDHGKAIAHTLARFAPDGTLWATSDDGSDFLRLGRVDPQTGRFSAIAEEKKWDVDAFQISADGSFIAYALNEAGRSRLKLLDVASGAVRAVGSLPVGVLSDLEIAQDGRVGFTLSSNKAAADAYSVDPKTLALTRWTRSETGGLNPEANVEPELIEVKSFDGETVSGFLYRPDATKFPGKRPLLFNIHGGPEGQFQPGFLGRNNYLINELGIAIFFPNVRGSTGYGKRFVGLDNGPFKREDSVKDIGAFLDRFIKDPGLDAGRFGETGGSYGGYMCYASAIRYGDRFRAANCVVAISNFVTFLENTQSYRRDLRRVEYGDERDPKQRAKLMAISPLSSVEKLRLPLFVVTGGNDPRVPASEADQIIQAVRAKGGTAWHLLAADEGHGFAKKANQDYQFWASLLFWQETLLK